jgi:hypothetical protein
MTHTHECDMLAVTLEGTQPNHVTKHAITQTKPTVIRLSKRTLTLVVALTKQAADVPPRRLSLPHAVPHQEEEPVAEACARTVLAVVAVLALGPVLAVLLRGPCEARNAGLACCTHTVLVRRGRGRGRGLVTRAAKRGSPPPTVGLLQAHGKHTARPRPLLTCYLWEHSLLVTAQVTCYLLVQSFT